MNLDEGAIIALGLLLTGAGGALGAALALGVFWRKLQAGAARMLEERLAIQIAVLRQEQQRLPQSVQQALQVELEFHAREQAERDTRHAVELREVLRGALAAYGWMPAPPMPPAPAPEPAAPAWPPTAGPGVAPPIGPASPGPAKVDAAQSPRALPQLSDAEIDALPADLPPPSRRVKPPLRPPPGLPVKRL
ncbi:hypothetical protein DFR41_11753 [Pseudacidovorax intermedius]|uniref:Uncharacterized protein n=2 Tax=Pseudacidovorax intermedius TaxID=433924 RepID=A0A370F788_9BURK|nr:hypothetical protein [Pseudacidovorax intermedius]RDI17327.1 hypothetical protein DFR41_11753 [Pseudacidovorax intermedius]